MRMFRSICLVVVLLTTTAQAVNTTVTLNDRGWAQTQSSLIGSVGPQNEGVAGAAGTVFSVPFSAEGVFQPMLDVYLDLSVTEIDDPLGSLAGAVEEGADVPEQLAHGLIDDINNVAGTAGYHWSTDPKKHFDAGFVNAGGRINLPAFAEIDWVSTPLPTARETFLMEIVVFPALGAILFVFAAEVLVLRLRRRKTVSPAEQLLRV